MKTIRLILWMIFGAIAVDAHATVTLPAIFGDHMVLQAGVSVPVWGWATPGEAIKVSFGSKTANTTADKDGKWQLRLEGLQASASPEELDVAGASNQITIHDVLIGDVWLCGGANPMSIPLNKASTGAAELPQANHPEIRLFVEKFHPALTPQTDDTGSWMLCTPATAKMFSAVGYYFGKEIAATEKTPVGIIGACGGYSPAQAWTSFDTLRADTDLRRIYVSPILPTASGLDAPQNAPDQWLASGGSDYLYAMGRWSLAVGRTHKGHPFPPRPLPAAGLATEPINPNDYGLPSVLYNGMIAPLIPFALKGVIWYQGESNTSPSDYYQKLFPAMIADWRQHWGQGDFPFLYVQLPNYFSRRPKLSESNSWSLVRDVQMATLDTVKNTGMVVSIDLADSDDVPLPDKASVGHRLAMVARHIVYGEDIVCSGPVFDSYKLDGDKIHVTFTNVGQGLKVGTSPGSSQDAAKASAAEIKGFAIAGEDHRFVPAVATLEEPDTVCLSNDGLAVPTEVRFGGDWNARANLYSSDDQPAAPFASVNPTAPVLDKDLVAENGDFYSIEKVLFCSKAPDGPLPVYRVVRQLDSQKVLHDVYAFTPYLEFDARVKQSLKSDGLIARAYFYDQDKKLIVSMDQPKFAGPGYTSRAAWPAILLDDQPQGVFFAVPDRVLKIPNWSAVVIFGDAHGVAAQVYSNSNNQALSDYDYPGKTPSKNSTPVASEHSLDIHPIITHVEMTGNRLQPQITMFMRLPLGIAQASEAKGVLCLCLLGRRVEDVLEQLQGSSKVDGMAGFLQFADNHKLIIIGWGSKRMWDPTANWDDMPADQARTMDGNFDQVAKAWGNGINFFVQEYGIPPNNYLLWGDSGSAQYACRLALRNPGYFLAVHAHIPSSFDKPTLQGNKVLWCLTTGELEAGHERSLRFYTQCRALGYPIIYKAIPGLGHAGSPIAAILGLKFFEYALSVKDQRTAYDQDMYTSVAEANSVQPWLSSFKNPPYVGDIVNQDMVPADQIDTVPPGYRTALPTKDLADAWNR